MFALALLVAAAAVDPLSDSLVDEHEAVSVSVEDADAGTDAEQPVFDEPGVAAATTWKHARVTALFDNETTATAVAAAVIAARAHEDVHVVSIAEVADEDWVRLTQAQFGPCRITDRFWIVPTWSDVPRDATHAIRLDPGRAFGTGTHPTTRMCLRWIAEHGELGGRVWPRALDYGCGSGVLAIAAGRFGAGEIDAVDVDPAAVETTHANALANDVTVRAGGPEIARGRYALVVANILAAPLKVLAPLLCSLLDADGTLVLSGILERQIDELRDAYAPWVALEDANRDDGWVLLVGKARRVAHGMISR